MGPRVRGDDYVERSGPRPVERKAAHRAEAHFAGDGVAGNLAGELQRQRHRIGDRDLPGDVVAVGRAVEDLGRIAVSLPPEFFKLSVALRSPIGVLMVMFQFPSTAIRLVSSRVFAKPEWFWDQDGLSVTIIEFTA